MGLIYRMNGKILPNGKILNTADLGKLISKKRKFMQLTQSEFAALSGVGVRFISELENGKESIHLGKALKILANMGFELHVLPRKWGK